MGSGTTNSFPLFGSLGAPTVVWELADSSTGPRPQETILEDTTVGLVQPREARRTYIEPKAEHIQAIVCFPWEEAHQGAVTQCTQGVDSQEAET
jgi:hypothetical protein